MLSSSIASPVFEKPRNGIEPRIFESPGASQTLLPSQQLELLSRGAVGKPLVALASRTQPATTLNTPRQILNMPHPNLVINKIRKNYNTRLLLAGGADTGGLVAVNSARFQILDVDVRCDIRTFVQKEGLIFKPGRGFYEFTKPEKISDKKEVVLVDKVGQKNIQFFLQSCTHATCRYICNYLYGEYYKSCFIW